MVIGDKVTNIRTGKSGKIFSQSPAIGSYYVIYGDETTPKLVKISNLEKVSKK